MAGNPAKCCPYCLRESNWREKRPPNRGLSARSILPGAVSNGPLAVDKLDHGLTARKPCKFPHPHRYSQIGSRASEPPCVAPPPPLSPPSPRYRSTPLGSHHRHGRSRACPDHRSRPPSHKVVTEVTTVTLPEAIRTAPD